MQCGDFPNNSIFKGLGKAELALLRPMMDLCPYPRDFIIFDQGQAAEYLYILSRGQVTVRYKPYDGPTMVIAEIFPGGVFGWSAALRRDCYSSYAVADEDCEAYRLRGEELHKFCVQYPETGVILLERLASVIAERLNSTHNQILALLSAGMDLEDEHMRKASQHG